ncbi:MAG: hypothetical protein MJY73_01940 [Bacteroidales bacterium]|nr:hypothetical protein [Bacteroidales bacterium]
MKKVLYAVMAIAVVLSVASCKNNNKKQAQEAEAVDYSEATAEKILADEINVDLANLVESAKKIKPVAFLKTQKDGKLVLSDKEKKVKPDYLIAPESANDLVTLSQKYRAVGMLTSDKIIAELYEMPTNVFNEAIFKLLKDINDPALEAFFTLPPMDIETNREAFATFVDDEYNEGRINFFWEGIAALTVEQVYILSQNIDKFLPAFTDETAADITYNFVCLHDGLTKTVNASPEMESLNEILKPLYVINAITVDELKGQLTQVKDEIAAAREQLLK